jgi:hypothetical protein
MSISFLSSYLQEMRAAELDPTPRTFLIRQHFSNLLPFRVSEGSYDIKFIITQCTTIMELEEEGVETYFVPRSARIVVKKEFYHQEDRRATFSYLRGDDEILREASYSW